MTPIFLFPATQKKEKLENPITTTNQIDTK